MRTISIPRRAASSVRQLMQEFPVVAIIGPRQSGKTTLAKQFLAEIPDSIYLDLELPSDLVRLQDSEAYLSLHAKKTICLDEVHQRPDLFPVLRALIDQDRRPGRFLILGSASPRLLQHTGETLAGRIASIPLMPFTLQEIDIHGTMFDHWLRGGYPDSFLAASESASFRWREQFIRTFLDRDIPALGIDVSTPAMQRLWTMLASSTATVLNRAKLADPVGVSPQTIARHIDILEAAFMVRVLRPYFRNTKKRLVQSPKVYLRDSGILHALLGLHTWDQLYGNAIIGASWESYAIEQIMNGAEGWTGSFYRTSAGAELDLVLEQGNHRIAIECKASRSPHLTRGFHTAAEDIAATRRYVVAPLPERELIPFGRETILCRPDSLLDELKGLQGL